LKGSWKLNSRYWTFGKKFNETFGFCPLENATLGWGSKQPTSDQLATCVALNFTRPTNVSGIEAFLTNANCKKKTFFACEVKHTIFTNITPTQFEF
jgi:hypothetical protein